MESKLANGSPPQKRETFESHRPAILIKCILLNKLVKLVYGLG
jgi:hypothetical protein